MSPIIGILAKVAVGAVADKVGSVALSPSTQGKLEKAVAARIQNDPALANDLNAEPLWRSRVANGSLVAFVGAVTIVVQKFKAREFDDVFAAALTTAIGTGYAFAGRALNWSKPMWSRVAGWFA